MTRGRRLGVVVAAVAVVAVTGLPAGSQPVGGPPEAAPAVAGAGTFTGAPMIEPGTYADAIRDGEVLFYRFELAVGQRAHVRARVFPNGDVGSEAGKELEVLIYDPDHLSVVDVPAGRDGDISAKSAAFTTRRSQTVQVVGPPVRSGGGAGFSASGEYYATVSLERDEEWDRQFPLALTVEVAGEPAAGASLPAPSPTTTPTPTVGVGTPSDDSGVDGGGDGGLPFAVPAGGLVVGLAVGGSASWWRRSRL